MAKRFENDWSSGSFGIFSGTTFGTTNGVMPKIISGTYGGRTGNWVQFETPSGQGRCELEVPKNAQTLFVRGDTQVSVEEWLFLPGFPFNPTVSNPWQVLRQWKDLGSLSTSPPMQVEATAGVIRFHGSHRGSAPNWLKTILSGPQVNVLYTFAFEVHLDGPGAGWVRALMKDAAGVWTELVPKTFPENGTYYIDGGQDWSRFQTGIYHNSTIGAAKRLNGYTGVGTSLADFGIVVGGTGGGTPVDPGTGGGTTPNPVLPVDVPTEVAYARTKVGLTKAALALTAYPHYIDQALGQWVTTTAAGWTSGFLPAIYWRLFTLTADSAWSDAAVASQAGVAGQATNTTSAGADLGHRMKPFMRAYEQTGTTSYRDTALTAATTISAQWDAEVGAMRSWANGVNSVTNFNTIVDSAAAMELLWWAARNGATDATTLRTRVTSHMQKLRGTNGHVRSDGSTFHVVEWNDTTGAMISQHTAQGFSNASTWSRGQAWAIYGFAVASREAALAGQTTDAADFKATAIACANYFLNNLPADDVPLWDFSAPATDSKDTSASAITAVGLFELAKLDTSVDWNGAGKLLVETLAANYHSPSTEPSVLDHGTSAHPQAVGIDTGLIYGDSYYLDALSAYKTAGLGTTKPLSILSTDSTWSQFPTRSTGAAVVTGKMSFTLDATTADAHADSLAEWVPAGNAALVGAITFPTWISGSGVIEPYMQLDWLDGNMIELSRRLTFNSASSNANKVDADTLEYRLIRPSASGGSSDPQPTIIQWSALPAGTKHMKSGFLPDGISAQTSVDGVAFGERAKRAAPSTFDVNKALRIRVGLRRPVPSDTIRVQTASIDKVAGSASPNANPAGTVAKTDKALRFARDTIRVFPFISGTVAGFLTILKPITTDRVMTAGGVSKAAGLTLLDTFTRADGAIGASYGLVGSSAALVISGNAVASPTSGSARNLWATSLGDPNHVAFNQVSSKPANPAATVSNWVHIPLRVNAVASASTTGYAVSVDLTTTGTSRLFFTKLTSAGSPGAGLNPSNAYATKTLATGDWLGARVNGTGATVTIECWYKPVGGIWELWGSYADSASPITSGNFAGLGAAGNGTVVTKLDNFWAGASVSLDEPFPVSRSGRSQRIDTAAQPAYRDNTLVPPGSLGGGTLPAGWSAVLNGRFTSDGHVGSYIWNATTNAWSAVENAGTIGAGATISDSGARYVIGDREPVALTDNALNADVAAHVVFSEMPTLAQAQAIVQPGGAITLDALKAMPNALRVYDLRLTTNTDQIVNALNPGTGDEVTGERVGTGAVMTDAGNVPLADGAGGGTLPTPIAAVPDGAGVRVTASGVDPGDATKATVTLAMDATAADATISYTPHATAPYQFGWSDGGPDGAITWLTAQATNTVTQNGQPLSAPSQEPVTRWWTGRYINNASVAGNPQRPYVAVTVVAATLQPVAVPVLTRRPARALGGTATIWVAVPPADQSVDEFHVRLTPLAANGTPSGAEFTAYTGAGVTTGGEVTLPLTGLSDAVPDYAVELAAYRTEA